VALCIKGFYRREFLLPQLLYPTRSNLNLKVFFELDGNNLQTSNKWCEEFNCSNGKCHSTNDFFNLIHYALSKICVRTFLAR